MLYNRMNLIKDCCDFIKSCQTQGVGYCLYNYTKFDVDFNFTVEDFYNYVVNKYTNAVYMFNPNGMCKLLAEYKIMKRIKENSKKFIEDLRKEVHNEDCVKL